jgi:hypothetical protein
MISRRTSIFTTFLPFLFPYIIFSTLLRPLCTSVPLDSLTLFLNSGSRMCFGPRMVRVVCVCDLRANLHPSTVALRDNQMDSLGDALYGFTIFIFWCMVPEMDLRREALAFVQLTPW